MDGWVLGKTGMLGSSYGRFSEVKQQFLYLFIDSLIPLIYLSIFSFNNLIRSSIHAIIQYIHSSTSSFIHLFIHLFIIKLTGNSIHTQKPHGKDAFTHGQTLPSMTQDLLLRQLQLTEKLSSCELEAVVDFVVKRCIP